MKRLTFVLALLLAAPLVLRARDFRFKVTNTGPVVMTGMDISEKGENKWFAFDIGGTIKPDQTVLLIWDEQPNEEDCEWDVRLTFANGKVKTQVVDFCKEKSLKFSAQ